MSSSDFARGVAQGAAGRQGEVDALTDERDDALNQLRLICRLLPQPPWFEEKGGADWDDWCDWITDRIGEAEAAEALVASLTQERDALKNLAMLYYSDPHKSAQEYRQGLREICNAP